MLPELLAPHWVCNSICKQDEKMKQLFEVILFINQLINHTPTFFYKNALDPLDWFTGVIKCGERIVLSGRVFEEKKFMKFCGCPAFKTCWQKNIYILNCKQLMRFFYITVFSCFLFCRLLLVADSLHSIDPGTDLAKVVQLSLYI